jgi:hypothetical protein
MTSSDFRPTDIYAAQQTAHLYCSSKIGETIESSGTPTDATFVVTDDQQAMAVSMLVTAMLIESRRVIKSRDENIIPRTINALFTQEMYELLIIGDVADEETTEEYVMWENDNPTQDWVDNY